MRLEPYVAFLRGINVGGHSVITMSELKKAFEELGFERVSPVLASGNVVFYSTGLDRAALKAKLEAALAKRLRVGPTAILRSGVEISRLLNSNPFSSPTLSLETKLQVTFLGHERNPAAKFPLRLASTKFQLIQVSSREICSAIDLSGSARTPELMKLLEKNFGKDLTTRTWATVEKNRETTRWLSFHSIG